jgi:hypothetical protein
VRTDARAAPVLPPEELSWDDPVAVSAESRASDGGGFLLRLHLDPRCPTRLVPDGLLVARRVPTARADALCPTCATSLVAGSRSSVVLRLRESARVLDRLRARAADSGPMPREVVHVRALRYEAETCASVHPDVDRARAAVLDLAAEVTELLRRAMASYDRRR